MGTFSLPNTTKAAKKLQELFEKPIYINSKTRDILFELYNDDLLFDTLSDIEYDHGNKYDVRYLLWEYIAELVNDYEENPGRYYIKFEKQALKILKKIVKDYF